MRRGLITEGLGLGIGQGAEYLPMNLREMEHFKKMQEKNLEVEEWLRKSPILGPRTRVKAGSSENRGLSVPKRDRRSKSISDFRFDASGAREPRQGGGGNGNIDDDTDSDDDVSQMDSSWEEGSLDAWAENPGKPDEVTSPAVDPEKCMDVDTEEEEYDPNKDPNLLPKPNQFYSAKPWRDDPTFGPTPRGIANPNQPHTSNAAMRRFKEANDRLETASRVATFGSARNTTSADADKFVNTDGILGRLSFGKDKDKDKEKSPKDRKSSIFEFPFKGIKRIPSNAGDGGPPKSPLGEHSRKDSTASSAFPPPKWRPTWSHQRRGKLSIDTAIGAMTGHLAAVGVAHGESDGKSSSCGMSPLPWSALIGANSLGPPVIGIGMKRNRSKSDLSNIGSSISAKLIKPRPIQKPEFGLATMMHLHGGPPAIPLPSSPTVSRRHTFASSTAASIRNLGAEETAMATVPGPEKTLQEEAAGLYDSDDDDEAEIPIGKPLYKLDIKPTFEGYAANVRELNPILAQKLVDRIAHEQVKRYKKLQDNRAKHIAAVARGDCHNKSKCLTLNPRVTPELFTKTSTTTNGSEEHLENTIIGAQYPFGVPDPPVTRLPAEFECTICFKVKRFSKPSDWTKHVHEDVQPFTCTFPDCTEPKSFKRKADWVRHENERHRHLEWWKCNQTDCQHICYRKDNFVQHLVREHKFPEPKVKAAKAAMKAKAGAKGRKDAASAVAVDPVQEQADKVLAIVELCHNDTKKEPTSEKCRFCGQTCTTWKKLTVHLARHMEQISLPILDLIKDDVKPTSLESALSPHIAGSAKPTHSGAAAGGQVKATAGEKDVTPDQLYPRQRHEVHPEAPPVPSNAANTLSPSTPIGGIGYYHNQPLLSTSNASMPALTASPTHMSITGNFAYEVDDSHSHHGSFHEQSFLEQHTQRLQQEMQQAQQQQGKQKLGNNNNGCGGAYYPSPSGSVSPYLMPIHHQTSPHPIHQQQQRLSGTHTPPMLGVGMMDPGRFAGTTPRTTPPRSSHSMRQFNSQGQQQQHQHVGLEGLGAGLNPLNNGTLNINMSMLNMSLPTTCVSMEQLQFTSAPAAPNGLGLSVGIGAGSVGLGLEQLSIDALERQLLSRDTGGGADQGLYGGPGPTIRTYQPSGGGMGADTGPRLGAFPMGGMDMTGVQVSVDDEASWAWGGGGGYGAQ